MSDFFILIKKSINNYLIISISLHGEWSSEQTFWFCKLVSQHVVEILTRRVTDRCVSSFPRSLNTQYLHWTPLQRYSGFKSLMQNAQSGERFRQSSREAARVCVYNIQMTFCSGRVDVYIYQKGSQERGHFKSLWLSWKLYGNRGIWCSSFTTR